MIFWLNRCGCEWRIWASMCKNESPSKLRPYQRSILAYHLALRKEGGRSQVHGLLEGTLRGLGYYQTSSSELKMIIDQELSYKASFKLCFHARKKVLTQIVGDYRGKFELLGDMCMRF